MSSQKIYGITQDGIGLSVTNRTADVITVRVRDWNSGCAMVDVPRDSTRTIELPPGHYEAYAVQMGKFEHHCYGPKQFDIERAMTCDVSFGNPW